MTRPFLRPLLATAALAAAIALGGCDADGIAPTGRAQAPLSEKMLADMSAKNMDKESPILARIFKEEAEMEIWKKDRNGEYALLKTYPICRWSGDLGPKKKEGDRQAPEGFYTITPGQMNPNSNYFLAFNTGYPNAYDRALGYTGSELMVHGDCSSRGCYAMTDEQMQEIYALARESFFGGQKAFQLQAFPFRMTALNMAKHRNSPHFAFWRMLKQGYDHFDATKHEPKVAVCEKRYVFDPAQPENASKPLRFDPKGKCPVYELDKNIAEAVLDHRRSEQFKMAEYIARGVSTAQPRHGIDGGMNPVFLAKLSTPENVDNLGRALTVADTVKAPGALPRTPNQPAARVTLPAQQAAPEPVRLASVPMPKAAPQVKEGEAPAQTTTIAGLFGNLFSGQQAEAEPAPAATDSGPVDLRGSNTELAAKPKRAAPQPAYRTASVPATAPRREATPAPAKQNTVARNSGAGAAPPQADAAPAAKPEPKPEPRSEPELRTAFSSPQPARSNGVLTGAQPLMPTGSFNSRWSAVR